MPLRFPRFTYHPGSKVGTFIDITLLACNNKMTKHSRTITQHVPEVLVPYNPHVPPTMPDFLPSRSRSVLQRRSAMISTAKLSMAYLWTYRHTQPSALASTQSNKEPCIKAECKPSERGDDACIESGQKHVSAPCNLFLSIVRTGLIEDDKSCMSGRCGGPHRSGHRI